MDSHNISIMIIIIHVFIASLSFAPGSEINFHNKYVIIFIIIIIVIHLFIAS